MSPLLKISHSVILFKTFKREMSSALLFPLSCAPSRRPGKVAAAVYPCQFANSTSLAKLAVAIRTFSCSVETSGLASLQVQFSTSCFFSSTAVLLPAGNVLFLLCESDSCYKVLQPSTHQQKYPNVTFINSVKCVFIPDYPSSLCFQLY